MSTAPVLQEHRRGPSRRATIWLVIVGVLVVLLGSAIWIGVRGWAAKGDLQTSVSLVSQIKSEIAAGDVAGARKTSDQLAKKVHSARDLTSDPIWRAAEIVPWAGANLTAVREASAIVSSLTDNAIAPFARLSASINVSSFKPMNGAIPLQPLVTARPTVAEADAAVQAGLKAAEQINASGTIAPIATAVRRLTSELHQAADLTDPANRAVKLLPGMMGASGPRNYVVLFQNNAEARSTGGISGALAMVHVENGAISLVQQAASSNFPQYPEPVLPLPASTQKLYGTIAGKFIQDVNLPPQFPLSAQLAREMWKRQFGVNVDGVLSIDPVALSYVLDATGPVTLSTGDQLTSGNAVSLLLNQVYFRYPNPPDQDAFFASAASSVFSKIAGGDFDPTAMITALARAGSEDRLLLWSSHTSEQSILAPTTLAGGLPASSAGSQPFGVYLNDATGAKMDYYLNTSIDVGQATCRKDGRPNVDMSITLKSSAPDEAATALPSYVTGAGLSGVPAGSMATNVAVYAPPGAVLLGATRDGKPAQRTSGTDEGRAVAIMHIELGPGQSATVKLHFLAARPLTGAVGVRSTPGVNHTEVRQVPLRCTDAGQ